MKPVIGLTGGVGAGKSSVARVLESLGAAVIDSDRLAHEILAEPEVVATLRSWWGEGVCTAPGVVNRRAIADIVFSRPDQLKRLEELLYPRIDQWRAELTAQYEPDSRIRAIVLDAPKLYEAGVDRHCDAVIFVDAEAPTRLRRLADSRGWTHAELQRREQQQKPLDIKKASADYIVANNSSIDGLRPAVEQVFEAILVAFSRTCS